MLPDGPSAVNEHCGVGNFVKLAEHVGRDHNGLSFRRKLPQHHPQLHAGSRVQAGRRLIEEQDGRIVDEGAGQAEALLLPPGEDPGRLVGEVAQADAVQHFRDPLRNTGLGQLVEACHLGEDFAGRQGFPHAQCVRHPADPPAHLGTVVLGIKPLHRDGAGVRRQQ